MPNHQESFWTISGSCGSASWKVLVSKSGFHWIHCSSKACSKLSGRGALLKFLDAFPTFDLPPLFLSCLASFQFRNCILRKWKKWSSSDESLLLLLIFAVHLFTILYDQCPCTWLVVAVFDVRFQIAGKLLARFNQLNRFACNNGIVHNVRPP